MTRAPLHHFAGRSGVVLHRSAEMRLRIAERMERLGIRVTALAGDLDGPTAAGMDMLVLDIDAADDGQLPWLRGCAPVPVVGLIGSESPGRLAWALGQRVDAFLPASALGHLFSALVIAHETRAHRAAQQTEAAERALQRSGRLDIIRAVLLLMRDTEDEALALKQLRTMAMVGQTTLEEAAVSLLQKDGAARVGKR